MFERLTRLKEGSLEIHFITKLGREDANVSNSKKTYDMICTEAAWLQSNRIGSGPTAS